MDEQLYKNMLDTLEEGIYFVSNDRRITFWNKGAEKITGFTSEQVLGTYCHDNILNHVDELGKQLCFSGCPLHATIEDGTLREQRVYLHHRQGHRIPVKVKAMAIYDEANNRVGAAEIFIDESNVFGKDLSEEELRAIAFTDALTQIPNRRATEGVLKRLQQSYLIEALPYTLALIDIDRFKTVNDTYGHSVGDEVLKMVAQTLAHATRSVDFVGRWGGEEFVMLLPGLTAVNQLRVLEKVRLLVASSILRQNAIPMPLEHDLSVTISIGASTIWNEATIEDLINRADERLYMAKAGGRNLVVCDTLNV